MHITLVSLNEPFIAAASSVFGSRADCRLGDIRDVPKEGAAFVSPANSFGFMDGGVDAVLRSMFPGWETTVKAAIRGRGDLTQLGRPYLRVGSAWWTRMGSSVIITAPTMFLPHDVSQTRNAYWSTMAALIAAERAGAGRIVLTSHCCGWGRMDPAVAATQMFQAAVDFHSGVRPSPVEDAGPEWVLLPSRDAEQPANYDNREIGVGAYADQPMMEVAFGHEE